MTVKIDSDVTPLLGLDLIPTGATIAVAVSGGGDSVALLHIISEWAKEGRAKPHILTVDHQLRLESANEALFVAKLCSILDLPHTTLIWSNPKSSQKAARKARHSMIAKAARTVGAKHILFGHTLNDVAETMMMREQRNQDIQKVAGPMPFSVSPVWPEGRDMTLLRPLLLVDRSTIRQWLEGRALSWIDDPSNENDTFERARIRKAMVKSADLGLARAKRALEARSAEEVVLASRLRECAKGCDAQGLIRVPIDFGAVMLVDLMATLIPAA
ncbi:MAG: tRNA lysidine(34) synthetase TilS, partial [Pseudomonadota bacterium]